MRFSDLPSDVQADFNKYEIGVDLLYDLPYRDILDIFARLNTYTVKLNGQELLNAKYVGYFKQLAYRLGYEYVEFLLAARIITKAQVTRMAEAELTSDLITALSEGVQTNKNIELQYRKYEEEFENVDMIERKFHETMSFVNAIYSPEDIAITNWSRIHLFYTLFTVVAHGIFGVTGLDPNLRPPITKATVGRTRVVFDDISEKYDRFTEHSVVPAEIPHKFAEFISFSRRGTTDTGARVARSNFVCNELADSL